MKISRSSCSEVFSLREKCPNSELFWSVFSLNTGKYGPEKTPYLETFYAVSVNKGFLKMSQNSQENTCTGV